MLEIMILFVLLKRDLTMYSIRSHMKDKFSPFSTPSFGAINPALKRLVKSGALTTSQMMSDGGKQSVFYSITNEGLKLLRKLLLSEFSGNPLQFISEASVKLCCSSFLGSEDAQFMFDDIKNNALKHKINAENILNNEYIQSDFYQKIVFDNTICAYNNFISMVEGLEKNVCNS